MPAPKDACVKPALVKEMEAFLGTEMLLVDPEDTVGRIKVARELFTMFIARFDVYKDVLSAVRDEYDALLLKYQALVCFRCLLCRCGDIAADQLYPPTHTTHISHG